MTPLDASAAEFHRTIADLGNRLANAAILVRKLEDENAKLNQRIAELEQPVDIAKAKP